MEWNKCERYYPSTLRDGYRRSFPKIWRTYLKGQEIIERISANCSECSTFGSLKINPHIFYWNFLKIYKIIIFEKKVTTLFKKKKSQKVNQNRAWNSVKYGRSALNLRWKKRPQNPCCQTQIPLCTYSTARRRKKEKSNSETHSKEKSVFLLSGILKWKRN